MTGIRLVFACGHDGSANADASSPVCPTCGEHRVRDVIAPPPRIVGTATGPHVETKDLPGIPVSLKG